MKYFSAPARSGRFTCILIILFFFSATIADAQIFSGEGLNMPGGYDGFNNPPSNLKFANGVQTPGGQLNINSALIGQTIWQTTFSAATSGGDIVAGNYDFLFTSGPSGNYYQNKWGGVTSWTLDVPNNIFIGGGQPNNNCTFTNGKYYTVNWLDQGYVDTRACIMETGGAPVSITTVTNSTVCVNAATTISFSLSAVASSQEIFYVRWSTDNFASSSLSTASVLGTAGSASIPAQTSGAVVKYYVFSSTVPLGNIGTDYDLCTIKLNWNGGANYSYTVPVFSVSETHANPSCTNPASGSIDITVNGGTPFPAPTQSYTQSFNTLANTGTTVTWTDNTTLANWFSNRTTYIVSTGSSTTGSLYSFGAAANNERAIGSVCSGTAASILYAVRITNSTGQTLTTATVNYTGEQWRNGGNTAVQKLDFAYQVNAANISSGTWTDVNTLDFLSPIHTATAATLDGNAAANQSALSATFAVSIAPGTTIWLRWSDIDDGGADHGLGVDELNVTLATAGGGTFHYLWSNGAVTEDVSGLTAGNYSVTVTDANGCNAFSSVTLTQPAAINLSENHQNISCHGGNNGSIDLTATGGTGAFTYLWSNGATTEDISNLTAGNYTVTVTDNGGCSNSLTTSLQEPAAISIATSHTDITCTGFTNGSIDISVTGGTPPYTYAWSNNAVSEDLTGLAAGTYTVTVTDFNGCSSMASATITEPSPILVSSMHGDVSCHGGNNGFIDVSVSGGTPSSQPSYQQNFNTLASTGTNTWTDNGTLANWFSNRSTYDASTGSTTTGSLYSFGQTSSSERALGSLASGGTGTILFGYAFTNTTPAAITSLTVNYTGEEWRCGGNTTQQKLAFAYQVNATNISSGTWTGVSSLDFLSPVNNATAAALDGNAALNRTAISFTFPVSVAPGATIWLRWQDVNDAGNDHALAVDDLSINFNAPGSGYHYSWSTGAMVQDIASLSAGNYTVNVTDNNGCAAEPLTVTISQPDSLVLSATSVDASCSVSSDGSVDLIVTGGTTPYTFNWSNGDISEDVSGLTPGNYHVQVNDSNSCTASLQAIIGASATATTWYADSDMDGFGDADVTIDTCGQPAGYVSNSDDCDDTNGSINPLAAELCNGFDDNCDGQTDEGCASTVTLHLKLFIEGYYLGGGQMQQVLYNEGIDPDPSSTKVDTVTIELHDVNSPYDVVATSKGMLMTDGTLSCTLPGTVAGNSYYIGLRHRSAIQTWSADPVLFNTLTDYDFTTSASQAFGNNMVDVYGENKWSIYTGDLNQDGNVDIFDFPPLDQDISAFNFGYLNTDMDGNGSSDIFDFPLLDGNIAAFIFASYPF